MRLGTNEFKGDVVPAFSQAFTTAIEELRPALHRYCARMTGSVFDGEDVVQETLALAHREVPTIDVQSALRPWLFRVAYNRAIDHVRRSERRNRAPMEELLAIPSDRAVEPDRVAARREQVESAFGIFRAVPSVQRSCVILKDILDYSLEEIASTLNISVPATKSALTRGREKLRQLREAATATATFPSIEVSPVVVRYAELFNSRDWDGLRALLMEDVRLELMARSTKRGHRNVSSYFGNYASIDGWHVKHGLLDAQPVLAFFNTSASSIPDYVVVVHADGEQVAMIRDYRYVPYLLAESAVKIF